MLKFLLKVFLLFNSFSVCQPYVMSCVTIQKHMLKNINNEPTQISMLELNSDSLLCNCGNLLNSEQSELLVKKMSSIFPQMDSISHFVLHANSQLITSVLENEYLKVETKKFLVLLIIQFTQSGDSTGSNILQFYHDFVQCLL